MSSSPSKPTALAQGTGPTRAQELVYELTVRQVMTSPVVTVGPENTMREFGEVLRDARVTGAPVEENGDMVGIVSMHDLIRCSDQGRMADLVRDWMSASVITVRDDDSVIEAVNAFAQRPVGRIPVVDSNGKLKGILTGGDITRGLLRAMDVQVRRDEMSHYRARHIFEDISSDDTSLKLRYFIEARGFTQGGEASTKVKRALQRLGGRPEIVRRVAVACYEAEMNLVIHTDQGGTLEAEVRPDKVILRTIDQGPGIPDVEQALEAGYSTAPDWIRDLGFGAGMGLQNIRRCADEFRLVSEPGVGSTLEAVIYVGEGERLGRGSGNQVQQGANR